MKTIKVAKRALATTCAAVIASFALAGSAFAATVHGADYQGTGEALKAGEVDVLNVDGTAGETVFLTVKAGGADLARNLPYTVGESAESGDEGNWTGVATLDIAGFDMNALNGHYTIEAYADRAGSDRLYEGALYGVYADLPDGSSKLIGTRTADKAELDGRVFNPPETLYSGGKTYRLADKAGKQDAGTLRFSYVEYDETSTIDGVIRYTDADGAVVASTKIPGLAYSEERSVDVPSIVVADNGDVYRTVYFKDAVVAANPGQTSFNIYCTKMSDADKALSGFYIATIQMVDENGTVIATDTVDVKGEFVYTAPTTIYKTQAANDASSEPVVITYQIEGSPVVRLSAANDGVLNRARTVQVQYKAQPVDGANVEVTFNLVDGDKAIRDKARKLADPLKITVDKDTPTAVPEATVEAGGVKYNIVGEPSDYAYEYGSGNVPVIDVYYVPEGYVAPGAKEVTVNYVNIRNPDVAIESHKYTSDPDENARITIDTPTNFSADGVDYVRLDGQEDAIQHSYYSGISTYTIYYRDVNDQLSAGTIINTIRVTYANGEEAGGVGAAAAAAPAAAEGAEGAAAGEGAPAAGQLNDGTAYNVFDGEDANATLANEEGVDPNTERIEDTETPLASGFDKGASSSAASSLSQMSALLVPIVIAAAVLIAAFIALMMFRRRKNNESNEA